MSETYTGLDAVPATSLKTDLFNKTSINADSVKERLAFYGAEIITTTTGQFIAHSGPTGLTGAYIIPFSLKCYDTFGFWKSDAPTGFYIPQGINYAEFHLAYQLPFLNADQKRIIINKNGTGYITTMGTEFAPSATIDGSAKAQSREFFLSTGIISVTPGDFFSAIISCTAVSNNPTGLLKTVMTNDFSGTSTITLNRFPCLSMSVRGYK